MSTAHLISGTSRSLDPIRRLRAGENLVSDVGGVGASAVGVELLPMGFAPLGEIVRVKVNADHAATFCLERFAADFCSGQPLIVGPMEFVTILKHFSQPVEVLPLEPHHASGLNALGHTETPEVEDVATVAQQGGAA